MPTDPSTSVATLRVYLLEALRRKTRPVAVALAVSKVDSLFKTEKDARAMLTSSTLRKLFGPLTDLVEQTPRERICRGAVIPISSFGFERAQAATASSQPVQEGEDDELEWLLRPGGLEWLLRQGVSVAAFNVVPLLLYSIIAGLQAKAGQSPQTKEAQTLVSLLEKDLEKLQACYLNIRR